MRIALLSALLLNTVCGQSADVYGCNGGWFEFLCKYQKTGPNVKVRAPGGPIQSTGIRGDVWSQVDGHRSLYHNTTGKYWLVHVKTLVKNYFGEYECKYKGFKKEIKLKQVSDKHVCPEHPKMAYIGASTTISCSLPRVNFICKESPKTCVILNGTNPVYHISNVSVQDQGVYWCGYKSSNRDYKVSKEKIHLQVVEVSKRRIETGQNLIHQCRYANSSIKKLVFKGEDPTTSHKIVSTLNKSNGSFTLTEFEINHTLILIIQHVKIEDSGSYWFGSERTERGIRYIFFHKLELTVDQQTTPPTHPDVTQSSPHIRNTADPDNITSPTVSPQPQDVIRIISIIAAVVCAVLLLLALIAFVIHRRVRSFAKTTNPNKEEHFYEEIQERPPQPGSGTALKTIYAIATQPDVTHNNNNKSKIFKDNVLYSVAK